MAIRMMKRVGELNKHWKKLGVVDGLKVRMGISTGFCTVGNFGSDLRLDYTVLGSPVNLAARLQTMAENNTIMIDEYTKDLIHSHVKSKYVDDITPKGFARPIPVYLLKDFKSLKHRERRKSLTHVGERVEVSFIDSGIDNVGKVFLLFMVSFSIMIISARAGASGTQLSKIHAAHSLGASKRQILRHVIFPNSLPEILTGIRVAVGMCWGTLVAAEFLAGTTGIGFVENVAKKYFQYEVIWITIFIMGMLGLLFDITLRKIIDKTIPWRGKG